MKNMLKRKQLSSVDNDCTKTKKVKTERLTVDAIVDKFVQKMQ